MKKEYYTASIRPSKKEKIIVKKNLRKMYVNVVSSYPFQCLRWSQDLIAWAPKPNFVVTARARFLVLIAANKSVSWIVAEKMIPNS